MANTVAKVRKAVEAAREEVEDAEVLVAAVLMSRTLGRC